MTDGRNKYELLAENDIIRAYTYVPTQLIRRDRVQIAHREE